MAQTSRNSIAVVFVMQIGGGNKGIIDSCTHKNKSKNILYRPIIPSNVYWKHPAPAP